MVPFYTSDKGKLIKQLTRVLAAEITRASINVRSVLSSTFLNGKLKSYRPALKSDFSDLVYTADLKLKTPQAYDESLDKLGFIFGVTRRSFESDEPYRQRIRFAIRSSSTKAGLKSAIIFTIANSTLFEASEFDVEIRESFTDFFDGEVTALNSPLRSKASLVGGITIYIRPKSKIKEVMAVVDVVDGTPIYDKVTYRVSPSIDYLSLVDYANSLTFKNTLETLVSAGIVIDKVIFEQPGSSGNRGEFYAYYEKPMNLRSN